MRMFLFAPVLNDLVYSPLFRFFESVEFQNHLKLMDQEATMTTNRDQNLSSHTGMSQVESAIVLRTIDPVWHKDS